MVPSISVACECRMRTSWMKLSTALCVLAILFISASAESIQLRDDHARTFFKLEDHHRIPKHEVIFPVQRHPRTHDVISHSTKVPGHRQRRSSSPAEHAVLMEPVDYSFSAFGQEFHLHLQNNYQLISDDFSTTVLHENGHNQTLFDFPLCYYHGTVISHDESPVAISNCDGLNGALYVENERFAIEPLPAGLMVTEYNGTGEPHVVSHSNRDRQGNVNDDRCFTEPDQKPVEVAPEYVTLSKGVESTHQRPAYYEAGADGEGIHNRTRRDVNESDADGTSGARRRNQKYALEVMLVLDQAMVRKRRFKSAEEANSYALSVANVASAHFNRGMLGIDLRFVVVRVLVLNRTQDGLRLGHHSVKSLRSFCQWQEQNHYSPYDSHPNHYDLSILLTGNELCPHQDHAGCSELGRAYVGGACYRYRMCSIAYDYGMGTGFVMAHETGHSLNLTHDGTRRNENSCSSERGTLMTAIVAGGKNVYSWSQCSKRELRTFAQSGQAYCLQDMPTRNLSRPQDMVGRRYSADEQCKLWLGESSAVCQFSYTRNKLCSELWCKSENNYCRTTHVPAAMGTPCGSNKVCYLGACVADTFPRTTAIETQRRPRPQDRQPERPPVAVTRRPAIPRRTYAPIVRTTQQVYRPTTVAPAPVPTSPRWGKWGFHGGCSRTCGGGIQFHVRRCLIGSQIVGWKNCKGTWYRFSLCNTNACPQDMRGLYLQDQCKRVGKRMAPGTQEEWFPGYMAATRCVLQCVSSTNRTFSSIVENGTPCSYRFNDRCVSGKCKPFGCDNVLQSSVVWDKCGVCGGNSSTCQEFSGSHQPDAAASSNTTVIRIPKGARSIHIKEGAAIDSAFIYLRFLNGRVALDGAWMQGKKQDTLKVFLAGTEFTYKQSPRRPDVLTSSIAPVNEDMIVELVRLRKSTQTVHWRFFMNPSDKDLSYHWRVMTGHCTVTCGEGEIAITSHCVKKGTTTPVEDAYCSTVSSKPKDMQVACRRPPCTLRAAEWVVRSWNSCSKTCGTGSQWRRVPCQVNGKNVQKSLCKKPRPRTSRKCNAGECPSLPINGQWSDFSPYSACSRSCGGGVQYRRRTCTNPEPRYDGKYCVGPSLQAQLCNTKPCASSKTYRAEQCAVYNQRSQTTNQYNWLPHKKSLRGCKLICTPEGSNQPVVKKSRASDGTRCHPIRNDRCIFGICRRIGCDNVINSEKVEDRCGVCGGNGSTCVDAASRFQVKHSVPGLYRVALIPKGARFVNISKKAARSVDASLVLALKNGKVLLSNEITPASGKRIYKFAPVASSYADYSRGGGYREQVRLVGPLGDDILIMLNVSGSNRRNPHLRYEYTIDKSLHRTQPMEERYTWSRLTSVCSATCGKGMAVLMPRCYQKRDGAMVDDRYCRGVSQPAPHTTMSTCNTEVACPPKYTYRWSASTWGSCSVKCGRGTQTRTVQCMRLPDSSVVTNRLCRPKGQKPSRRQQCMGSQCIPAASWSVGRWGDCSVTCGAGRQTRQVTCRRYEVRQQCSGVAPPRSKSCSKADCSPPPPSDIGRQCKDRQSADFCRLVVVYGLCTTNPEYHKLCCRHCTDASRRRGR